MADNGFKLSNALRPKSFEDIWGQEHIVGEGAVFRCMVEAGKLFPTIFWGPPGMGKTTIALVACTMLNKSFGYIDCTNTSTENLRRSIEEYDVLILDEIQYLTKRQQQVLLNPVESQEVSFIGCTTEHPSQQVFQALLDRSNVYRIREITPIQKQAHLKKICDKFGISYDDAGLTTLAERTISIRQCWNIIETLLSAQKGIYEKVIEESMGLSPMQGRKSELISALQKSIRGSDPDASIYYLGQLLNSDELEYTCRRLRVIASEDVGLANSTAVLVVSECIQSALQIGLPEAKIPLAHAVLFMALSSKSNSAVEAINAAMETPYYPAPLSISSENAYGYVYPHDYPNHYYDFDYLPKQLKGKYFYTPCDNKWEVAASQRLHEIKAQAVQSEQDS